MDVFDLRRGLIDTYREYATSFMRIRDDRIRTCVEEALDSGRLWPHPRVGMNPAFEPGGTIEDLVGGGVLHRGAASIFRLDKSSSDTIGRPLSLYRHQTEAISTAADDRNYVLTTGTGSGKSLAYIIPIVDHVLRSGSGAGVKAIVVYPMNALANSQMEELSKFLDHGPWVDRPVTFERYTGQDDEETRDRIQRRPPGHPADQLRDARAHTHPLPGPEARAGIGSAALPGAGRTAQLPGPPKAPTWPSWCAVCVRHRAPERFAVWVPPPRCPPRGHTKNVRIAWHG